MANPFEVSGVDSKMRRVSIDRDYLIQILEKSFPALEFPMPVFFLRFLGLALGLRPACPTQARTSPVR